MHATFRLIVERLRPGANDLAAASIETSKTAFSTHLSRSAYGRRRYRIDEPQSELLRQCPDGESFFHTLMTKLVHHRDYKMPAKAERDIFAFIKDFYNRTRLYSAIEYTAPLEVELELLKPVHLLGEDQSFTLQLPIVIGPPRDPF